VYVHTLTQGSNKKQRQHETTTHTGETVLPINFTSRNVLIFKADVISVEYITYTIMLCLALTMQKY